MQVVLHHMSCRGLGPVEIQVEEQGKALIQTSNETEYQTVCVPLIDKTVKGRLNGLHKGELASKKALTSKSWRLASSQKARAQQRWRTRRLKGTKALALHLTEGLAAAIWVL